MSEFAPLIYVDLAYTPFVESPLKGHGPDPARHQPWRLLIKSGDNQKPLFRSTESYFNRDDAIHAAELAFGSGSNVYLREAEHGNRVLRMAVPE
jgi:hypothetical protein